MTIKSLPDYKTDIESALPPPRKAVSFDEAEAATGSVFDVHDEVRPFEFRRTRCERLINSGVKMVLGLGCLIGVGVFTSLAITYSIHNKPFQIDSDVSIPPLEVSVEEPAPISIPVPIEVPKSESKPIIQTKTPTATPVPPVPQVYKYVPKPRPPIRRRPN